MTDIQALIEEAKAEADAQRDLGRLRSAGLMERLAAALSALSSQAETETEWALRCDGDEDPYSDTSEDLDWLLDGAGIDLDGVHIVRRRKAAPWIEVV